MLELSKKEVLLLRKFKLLTEKGYGDMVVKLDGGEIVSLVVSDKTSPAELKDTRENRALREVK